MRIHLLAIALASVALAGCSEAPPSGEVSSSGSAMILDGHVHSSAFTEFDDPLAGNPVNDQAGGCTGDDLPRPPQGADPFAAQRCTYSSSEVNYLFVALSPPGSGMWRMGFVDPSGTNPNEQISDLTANADGTYVWNYTADHERDDNMEQKFGTVGLFIQLGGTDYLVATSGVGSGSSLAAVPAVSGVGFSATYSGKNLNMTVSGIDAAYGASYTGWLVTVDPAGVKTHAESFPISGNGAVAYKATKNVNQFQELHIHLGSSNVNLATASLV